MKSIGFDFGSGYTKAVLLGDDGRIEHALYRKKDAGDLAALLAFVDAAGEGQLRAGIVGLSRPGDGRVLSCNALVALAAGVAHLHPQARSVIEIGGHTSKFVVMENAGSVRDFATNEACAAGTGSFLEQQAKRLQLSVEQLSQLSVGAKRGATIAGRCAVFAKSDMIHLQQKGAPIEEIAYGLCLTIARNAMTTLLKGRDAGAPLVIAGGCARNAGVIRAFAEVLPIDIVVSMHPALEGAIGAAVAARGAAIPTIDADALRRILSTALAAADSSAAAFAPLTRPSTTARLPEPTRVHDEPVEAYLGVDVGSVSTDLVLLDAGGTLQSSVYLPTRGRPVDVLLEGLATLQSRFPAGLTIAGCGATGSGRHLAARILCADVVKNEITCQMLGARRFVADVDTILEIGGQDSKFIAMRGGAIADFTMNKICAAGTGSFLEEQAAEMGIDIQRHFAAHAFGAAAPLDLGSRCTVFMETEVVNALGGGAAVDEICAGLAYSIVMNYLDKVVGARPLGRSIVFQGGVASNDAVVAAFENVLGRPIHVHPYNRISGAIGAALAAIEARKGRASSSFRAPAPAARPSLRSFECGHCSNRCEVNVINMEGRRAFFGDTCERYTSRTVAGRAEEVPPNLAEEYVEACEALFGADAVGLTIGIPRASTVAGFLPFWAAFFKALGHRPLLSAPSSGQTLATGLKHLSVGVCLPMKLLAGHVHELIAGGTDLVFVPSIVLLPGDAPSRSYSCPYAMAAPFIVSTKPEPRLFAPVISMYDEEGFVDGFAPYRDLLDVSQLALHTAWRDAVRAQEAFDARFARRAAELVARGGHRHVFAVLGKPYNTLDGYLNLSLFERLRRLGVLAIPQKLLPPDRGGLHSELPWALSGDMHRAAAAVARDGTMHPVIVSNFGCGPDAFTFKQIEQVLAGKPHLMLEFDEHRGEAGLITRVEAFLDQLESSPRRSASAPAAITATPALPPPGTRVELPYFADHAHAYAGLLRRRGCDARVLPPPGDAIRALGERHAAGKECHAYAMIAGDLLDAARRAGGAGVTFFFPGTSLPCLLHEYGRGMRALLRELDIENVTVCVPSGAEIFDAFRIDAMEELYLALLSIDLLGKAVCGVRPYERERGMTDAVHRENLERIGAAVAGGGVLAALDESLRRLSEIAVTGRGERPVVGICGDVYTRVNAAANHDLVRWLESQGLEVWPSPFHTDMIDFGISHGLSESVAKLDVGGLLLNGSMAARRAIQQWRVRRIVGGRVPRQDEPGYLEMKRLTAPYMPNDLNPLLFINVAKVVDFARHGADGIINAICFNCMIGNASAAVNEKIRRDYGEVPIITAVYSGGEDPSRRLALEAFVNQVAARHDRRPSSCKGMSACSIKEAASAATH